MLPAAKGGKKQLKLGWSDGTDQPKKWGGITFELVASETEGLQLL
jgi:hypothetical protein